MIVFWIFNTALSENRMVSGKKPHQEKCYMCDKDAETREHVPPQCLFPEKKDLIGYEDTRKNLITVPSCYMHNSKKSADDQYLMLVLMIAADGNDTKLRHYKTKGSRTLRRDSKPIYKWMKSIRPIIREDTKSSYTLTPVVKINRKRIYSVIKHTAYGIYLHKYNTPWVGNVRIQTSNLLFNTTSRYSHIINTHFQKKTKDAMMIVSSIKKEGSNPMVFYYQIYDSGLNKLLVITFYEKVKFVITFDDRHVPE